MKTFLIHCFLLIQFFTLSLQDETSNEYYAPRLGAKINDSELEVCKTMKFQKIGDLSISEKDKKLRFRAALECCQHHGMELLSDSKLLKSRQHWKEIKEAIKIGDRVISPPWVSATSILGTYFQWGTGEFIPGVESYGIDPWAYYEPKYVQDDQCAVLTYYHSSNVDDTRIDNKNCKSETAQFICEAPPPPDRGEHPTSEDESFCESVQYQYMGYGYTIQYYPTTQVNQRTAARCCAIKGGKLVSGRNLRPDIKKLLDGKIGQKGFYWSSGNNLAEKDVFRWGTGHIISNSDSLWGDQNGPQTLFPIRNCLAFRSNGTSTPIFYQVSCNAKLNIMCEADVNPCCEAVDELVSAAKPEGPTFYFEPSNSSAENKLELIASVTRHLSPSIYTKANWLEITEKNYLKRGGQDIKLESRVGTETENKNECPPMRKVWRKYTATCGDVTAVYYKGPEYTNSTDPICKNSKDEKCPDFCMAADKWTLYRSIKSFLIQNDTEEGLESRSGGGGGRCPLLQFRPAIAKDDYTYALIEIAVKNQLSPSLKTGVNYKEYFKNFYAGTLKEDTSEKEVVPDGHFMNGYRASFKCGKHLANIDEFKSVLFKIGDDVENCKIAKTNGVPLKECKSVKAEK